MMDVLVTIALVGVLSALSMPRFTAATARAKRVEARVGLSMLWRSQRVELLREGEYAGDFDQLAFAVEGGEKISKNIYKGARYTYYLSQPWGERSFYAVAEGNIDSDATTDILVILEKPPKETP